MSDETSEKRTKRAPESQDGEDYRINKWGKMFGVALVLPIFLGLYAIGIGIAEVMIAGTGGRRAIEMAVAAGFISGYALEPVTTWVGRFLDDRADAGWLEWAIEWEDDADV